MSAEPEDKFDWAKYLMEGEDADMGPYPDTPVSHRAHLYNAELFLILWSKTRCQRVFAQGDLVQLWCGATCTPHHSHMTLTSSLTCLHKQKNKTHFWPTKTNLEKLQQS